MSTHLGAQPIEDPRPAGRWFSVDAITESASRPQRFRWRTLDSFLLVLTEGLFFRDLPQPSTVRLIRRLDGAEVALYEHRTAGEFEADLALFRARLVDTPVFDFCNNLGIEFEHVVGEGQDFVIDEIITVRAY